ncbi:hypothetical protein V8O11_07480 [Erwinia aphidicola]|uniref:hypothetical protein n=1 Tax=Erwinia aphidicola TaxID=68334 RepID=UPI00300CEFA4
MNIVKQKGIAPNLLLCSLGPLSEMPSYSASTKNRNNTAKQPTEMAIHEYRRAKNKRHGVNDCINSPIECLGNSLKPIAVPDSKYKTMHCIAISWLIVHCYLVLFIVVLVLAFFSGRSGLSGYVKFIHIGHFLLLVGGGYAARFLLEGGITKLPQNHAPGMAKNWQPRPGA